MLQPNKNPELKEYVLNYVKEHCIERWDTPLEALPHRVVVSPHLISEFEKYSSELKRLENLTDEGAKAEEIAYREKDSLDYSVYSESQKQKLEDLTSLQHDISMWDCPTSLSEIKQHMLDDITSEIQHIRTRCMYTPFTRIEICGAKFKKEQIDLCKDMVNHYNKQLERETEWANATNKMLKELKDNLGNW